MAYLLDTTINGILIVTEDTLTQNLIVDGTVITSSAANTVDVYANGQSLQISSGLNFVNTETIQVSVVAGAGASAGNANISFSLIKNTINTAPSADQNNYNPAGLSTASELRVNATASIKMTGLAAQADGTRIKIVNDSTNLLWLEHENTSSTTTNRFVLPDKFPVFLMPGDTVEVIYSTLTIERWYVVDWPNRGACMGLTYYTDFIESPYGGMVGTLSGTGASIQGGSYSVTTTELPQGITQLDTGTTSTGRTVLGNAAAGQFVPAQGPALHVSRLAVEQATSGTQTFTLYTGFNDAITSSTPTHSVAWKYGWSGSAATWYQSVIANGSETTSTTNSPAADLNYNWFVIYCNSDWSRVDFITSADSTSFTLCSSISTGIPSSSNNVSWVASSLIKSVGTTQVNATIDLAGYRVDGVRG
jgi:hypothetical protein